MNKQRNQPMGRNYRRSINRLRERIDEADELSAADADVLRRYTLEIDSLGPAEIVDSTHEKYLMRLVKTAKEVGGLADALEEKQVAKEINSWFNSHYPEPESNKTARDSLRSLGEHATDGEGKPESIEWIPTGYPNTYDPAPEPSEMLRWDNDVLPMIESCHNHRDRALIALAFDAGPRSGELQDLTVGDISDHDYGLQVTVNGKTGRRTVTLIPSVPYVQQWLQVHPERTDQTAPFWAKLNQPESISGNMIRKALREAADRADINRSVTPTNFRKSSASYLANRGMSQPRLEDHHGWQRGSEVAARYIAVFGDASDRELARIHGLDVEEDEPDPIAPVNCPRCSRENPRDEKLCIWCGQALDPTAVESLREREDKVRTTALQLVKENPAIAEEIQQAQDLMRLFENNPDLFGEVQDFAAALTESGH